MRTESSKRLGMRWVNLAMLLLETATGLWNSRDLRANMGCRALLVTKPGPCSTILARPSKTTDINWATSVTRPSTRNLPTGRSCFARTPSWHRENNNRQAVDISSRRTPAVGRWSEP